MTEMKILISSDPKALNEAKPDVTIEAEYGAFVVDGRLLTLAHHGERGENPPPSTRKNDRVTDAKTIGVSHIDLDTLGGIMSVKGTKPEAPSFWKLVGFVDLNGAHKLDESGASEEDLRRLYAYWAGSKEIRVIPPKDGVADVTDQVSQLEDLVHDVISGNPELLEAGDAFLMEEMNEKTFVELLPGNIILRRSKEFVNHLYTTPDGVVARAIVTHNPSPAEELVNGAITASLKDPVEGVNIGELLGEFFTPKCGGHPGIGGTERGLERPESDARAFASLLAEKLG